MTRLSIILSLLFLGACNRSTESRTYAPDFRLNTTDHGRFYLNEYRGKVVVLVFWQTVCVPCKVELATLKNVYAENKEQGLIIAAICADPEDRGAVDQILEGLDLPYPVLLDEGGCVGRKYRVSAYPTTVIIDRRGHVLRTDVGYTDGVGRQLTTRIAQALSEEKRK